MLEQLRRATAADVDLSHAAAALDGVFAEYLVPISFSEPIYAIHVSANDVDLGSSPIWYDDDDAVVAAALLGVRDARGWIGGFGVAPEHRKRGLGRALLCELVERAWALGLTSIALEVLAENVAARRTYEAGGFGSTRRLQTFGADAKRFERRPADAAYTNAEPFLDVPNDVAPCWQREAASLRRQTNLHAVGNARAFCVFRHNGERAQLLKVHADSTEEFTWLIASVVAQTGVTRLDLFNEPAGSAAATAARSLGWYLTHEMDEMVLERARP
jgi:ribosomal protein S18 acetylase RimI-like enzyme